MKENLTEVIFILDRSGSMNELTNDTIGGFNTFIEKQKNEPGEALITTVLFDDQYEVLHNGVNLKDVKPLSNKEYFTRGWTALLDAIGKTINTVGARLYNTPEEEKPSNVIMVITTDGEENSSKEFNQAQIKEMIELQTNTYNWEFVFLGANIDAVSTARGFGIKASNAATYTASNIGTQSLYSSVCDSVSSYRATGKMNDDWSKDIK